MARTRSTWLAELLGLCSLGLALLLLISLGTYHPADPVPFFKAGVGTQVKNFIGPIGAFLAELFIAQLFGVASLLLPLVLGIAGWRLFWCKPVQAPYTKAVGLAFVLLSLTAILTLSFGTVRLEGESVRAGGAVGAVTAALLAGSLNRTGAYIVAATTLFVSVVMATQFSFAALLAAVAATSADRLRAARLAFSRLREARRKEKMRREVIRKHALKDKEPLPLESLPRVRKVQKPLPATDQEPAPSPVAPKDEPDLPERRPELPKTRPERRPRPERPPAPGAFVVPPPTLLDELPSETPMDKTRLFDKARILQAKCGEFGVLGNVVEIHPGPVVTTYEFKPDAGIKYSKIVGLSDDLALALEAESIRIDRMSGRGTVGIEIPNEVRETISLREILESDVFTRATSRLTIALGKTVSGDTYVTELAAMPHLLIAGATGTGKSVGLNCMLASILFKATPEEVRVILIDPKRLELGVYEDIPHLLTPVVTEPKVAANVLKWAVAEMEKRIRKLASEGVRNIEQYNSIVRAERTPAETGDDEAGPLHYIVIVIDELADLMMVSSHEVEESITRLAQMARAVGIHLILATQRPSVDVLTGLIKANFPSRISFRVAARVDSRTILDSIGAEHLLGKGDMLFLPPGSARLLRIHGAYVSEKEIARLTSYLRKSGRPAYDETVGKPERAADTAEMDERDELFDEAVRFVVQSGQASTSMLQRRFRIGFSRAGRLVDIMEREGIVGPADGSKPREILVAADAFQTAEDWVK